MSFSNYLEAELLDHLFGKGSYAPPTIYVGLSAGAPTETGTSSEASGDPTQTQNATELVFPEATADWSSGSNMTHAVLYDAATAGNLLAYGTLSTPKAVTLGSTAKFAVGSITVELD
jgi:hypothetical protein